MDQAASYYSTVLCDIISNVNTLIGHTTISRDDDNNNSNNKSNVVKGRGIRAEKEEACTDTCIHYGFVVMAVTTSARRDKQNIG